MPTFPRRQSHSRTVFLVLLGILLVVMAGVQSSAFAAMASTSQARGVVLKYNHAPLRYAGHATPNAKLACESPTAVDRCFLPQDFYKAYNIQPLLRRGITGKGRTIVIIDASESPTLQHDLSLFDKIAGLKDPTLNIIAPFGLGPFDPDSAGEITLDVETAHAIAPDATIDLALTPTLSPSDLLRITQFVIDNNLGDVISESIGGAENCDPAYVQAEHQLFEKAKARHITVFVSAGDTGSAIQDCQTGLFTVQGVQYPASDPLVTSVGGTTLYADAKSRYVSETAWNESSFARPQENDATGGGFSVVFPRPNYQAGISSTGRGVPDIAYNADSDKSATLIVCSSCGMPPDSFVFDGGTSAGAPQWAGIAALADQLAGERLGFLNPALYTLGKHDPSAFHDVVLGNNTYSYTDANGNPITIPGFSTAKGWDPVTGWGSPNVAVLVPLLIDAV